jgi:hypothetical protein
MTLRLALAGLATLFLATPTSAAVVLDTPSASAALGPIAAGGGEALAGFAAPGEIFAHSITFEIPADGAFRFVIAIPRNAPGFDTTDLLFNVTGFTPAGVDINFGATFVDGATVRLTLNAPFGFTSFRIDIEGLASGTLGANYAANLTVTPLPAGLVLLASGLAGLGLLRRVRR